MELPLLHAELLNAVREQIKAEIKGVLVMACIS